MTPSGKSALRYTLIRHFSFWSITTVLFDITVTKSVNIRNIHVLSKLTKKPGRFGLTMNLI